MVLRPRLRRLTAEEKAFARRVFAESDPARPDAAVAGHDWLDRVVVTSVIGRGRRAFVLPFTRRLMFVNIGTHFDDPRSATTRAYPVPGQLLIHELVHAWQFSTSRSTLRTFLRAVREQIRDLRGADVYGIGDLSSRRIVGADAGTTWAGLTLEQQATVVDRWYAGATSPTGRAMDPDSPHIMLAERVRGRSEAKS